MIELNKIYNENCLDTMSRMPDNFIDCCITSPPYYGLRDYGHADQIGLEETPELYVQKLVDIFREVKRVLKKDGTLWLNLGDTYYNYRGANDFSTKQTIAKNEAHKMSSSTGKRNSILPNLKGKDLIGIPWMAAFALRADGWYLRQDIIWSKKNCMPESVTDRCTKSHEYVFLLAKSQKYYYDADAIKTKMDCSEHDARTRISRKRFPTKLINGIRGNNTTVREYANKRSVWETTVKPFKEAHFATFPEKLIVDMIKAGCPERGIVYDPFNGAGTTNLMSHKLKRNWIGSEISKEYCDIAQRRIQPYLDQKVLF